MKIRELRNLSDEELIQKEREFSQELFNLRFQKASGQLGSPARIEQVKRDRARIFTLLNERRRGGKA